MWCCVGWFDLVVCGVVKCVEARPVDVRGG